MSSNTFVSKRQIINENIQLRKFANKISKVELKCNIFFHIFLDQNSLLFSGAAKINVIDITKVDTPRIIYHTVLGDFDPTDVEVCGDHVFVSLDNNQEREKGRLVVFKKYDSMANTLESILNITGM